MAAVIKEALLIAGHGSNAIHVSFDLDVVDPTLGLRINCGVKNAPVLRDL